MYTSQRDKIHLPKSVSTINISTIDPELRSEINTALLQGGHVQNLKEQLDHAMSVAPGDWKGKIEAHARNLMRMLSADGQPIYNTFEKVLDQVLADIKADTEIQRQKALDAAEAAKNGKIKITVAPKETGLALPKAVVEEGRLATETALREVCVVDD